MVANLFQIGGNLRFALNGVSACQQIFFNREVRKTVAAFQRVHYAALDQVKE